MHKYLIAGLINIGIECPGHGHNLLIDGTNGGTTDKFHLEHVAALADYGRKMQAGFECLQVMMPAICKGFIAKYDLLVMLIVDAYITYIIALAVPTPEEGEQPAPQQLR